MAQTVGDLIRNQQLTSVPKDLPVHEAIAIMVDHDYSQLPVLDDGGRVVGLFTERKLTRAILLGIGCDIDDWPVSQLMEEHPTVVRPDFGLYKAARLLADIYAVVVGDDGKPLGIVTNNDIAVFLADWSRGITLVEDIEGRLRGYINRVLSTAQAREAALHRAFGHHRDNANQPAKKYDELTLREHVQLITAAENWPRFEPYFKPKQTFIKLMDQVVPIRNRITHFRGELSTVQITKLETVRDFLASRPQVPEAPVTMEMWNVGER